jgi:putative transposase
VKIRDEGMVRSKAIHIALGARADGRKEVLGLWIEQNEGAKFWLRVMNELKNRGVDDIMLAVVDGLKGLPPLALPSAPRRHHRRVPRHGGSDVHRPPAA